MPTFDFHLGHNATEALARPAVLRVTEEVHEAAFSSPILRGRGGRVFGRMRDFYQRATEIDDEEAMSLLTDLSEIGAMKLDSEELMMFLDALRLVVEKAIREDLVVVFVGP